MTHQPDSDEEGLELPADVEEVRPPADVESLPLPGLPIGELKEETFDYDPEQVLEEAIQDSEAEGPVAIDVVIQMGHVPMTTGATGAAGEQDFARAVAGHAVARLQEDGRRVHVIGARDEIPASKVFVALHADGADAPSAFGASVGHRSADGSRIAQAWKAAYQRGGWSRGFRADNYTTGLARYYGTGEAEAAGTQFAFILEAGFLTNAEDRALIATPSGHARCAEAVRQAVTAVLGGGGESFLPDLSDAEQTRMLETTIATNAEVGRLAVAIRDGNSGLGTQVAALRSDAAAVRATLDQV